MYCNENYAFEEYHSDGHYKLNECTGDRHYSQNLFAV